MKTVELYNYDDLDAAGKSYVVGNLSCNPKFWRNDYPVDLDEDKEMHTKIITEAQKYLYNVHGEIINGYKQ